MTALVWDAIGEKLYEGGIDRGVLYVKGVGVAWNGLLSVDEVNTDTVAPVHIDGFKIRNIVSIGDLEATLRAYTYPDEFLPCDGFRYYQGMYVDGQLPQEFSLTYRTHIGNDVDGHQSAYKIHILYNLTANADTKTYRTFSLSPEPTEFTWQILGRPEEALGYRPTSHFIIDSRMWDDDTLKAFEEILYGTPISQPILPSFDELLQILNPTNMLIILDHGNGEWTAVDLAGVHIIPYGNELFELTAPTVVVIDADTFEASSYTSYTT